MRTLSLPGGTVGGTIGRIMYPLVWQYAAKFLGYAVRTGMMGETGGRLLTRIKVSDDCDDWPAHRSKRDW